VGRQSGIMSEGKPALVSMMSSPEAGIRWCSGPSVASHPRVETSCSRRSQALVGAGQVRMARWNDCGSILQGGQVVSGSLSNQELWATR